MGAGNSSLAEDICSDHILTNSLQKLEQLFFPVGEYLRSAQSPNKSHVTSEALKKFLVLKLKKKKKLLIKENPFSSCGKGLVVT